MDAWTEKSTKNQNTPSASEGGRFVHGAENAKKPGPKPWNCGNYSLTKTAQYGTMIIHTVILCLFLDFTSNMVILSQEWTAVKWIIR